MPSVSSFNSPRMRIPGFAPKRARRQFLPRARRPKSPWPSSACPRTTTSTTASRETLRQLEPIWRKALAEGRLLAADNPVGQAFLVKSIRTPPNSRSSHAPRPFWRNFFCRSGLTDNDRSVALRAGPRQERQPRHAASRPARQGLAEDPTLAGLSPPPASAPGRPDQGTVTHHPACSSLEAPSPCAPPPGPPSPPSTIVSTRFGPPPAPRPPLSPISSPGFPPE